RVVSTSGVAQIQCVIHPQSLKYQYPEEARVTVLKGLHGNQELCSSILNFTDHRETQVTLSGLNATDTDMYRCEIQIFYPPPYLRLTGNGTLIHVLGKSAELPESKHPKHGDKNPSGCNLHQRPRSSGHLYAKAETCSKVSTSAWGPRQDSIEAREHNLPTAPHEPRDTVQTHEEHQPAQPGHLGTASVAQDNQIHRICDSGVGHV
uniref:Immunoglobulin V-set domain-containing protein n=1 Tax=Amphilophus citrinellus TaxID=61819 RepID=A0A3Q0SLR6_AMPCI